MWSNTADGYFSEMNSVWAATMNELGQLHIFFFTLLRFKESMFKVQSPNTSKFDCWMFDLYLCVIRARGFLKVVELNVWVFFLDPVQRYEALLKSQYKHLYIRIKPDGLWGPKVVDVLVGMCMLLRFVLACSRYTQTVGLQLRTSNLITSSFKQDFLRDRHRETFLTLFAVFLPVGLVYGVQ